MDTRTPTPMHTQRQPTGAESASGAASAQEEGLGSEVQMLSAKLVNAINNNTNLDDSLQSTRHELEMAHQELAKLRAEKKSLDDAVALGVLVRRVDIDRTIEHLRSDLTRERLEREKAEKARKQTEGELENLTSALFEEANTMVASARKDTETMERRNSQLRSQLNDTEVLLANQQEQLQDLKQTMEKLERFDASKEISVPSTPATAPGNMDAALPLSPGGTDGPAELLAEHPLHFTHLLQTVLRHDVPAYSDFAELMKAGRFDTPHSRNASGSAISTSLFNLGSNPSASMSSPSLPGAFGFGGSGSHSAGTSPSSATLTPSIAAALKDTKFYKRVLVEDLDPTLRLDLAPGLSFLSRRAVTASLLNGTLVVEPFHQANKAAYAPVFSCALCGESRKHDPYLRKYRFRTSEAEESQRYPLCDYCLGRVRAAGDFLGFLRMVRGGHWRCEGEEAERDAWEEAVRLRERMFWARLGGGVVSKSSMHTAPAVENDAAEANSTIQHDAKASGHRNSVLRQAEGPKEADTSEGADASKAAVADCQETKSGGLWIQTSANDATQTRTTACSEQEQAAASAQLQQEARAAQDGDAECPPDSHPGTPTLVVPDETLDTTVRPDTPSSQTLSPLRRAVSRSPSPPKCGSARDPYRPSSPSKLNPARFSPPSPGSRPASPAKGETPAALGASSVLARVRAMEKR